MPLIYIYTYIYIYISGIVYRYLWPRLVSIVIMFNSHVWLNQSTQVTIAFTSLPDMDLSILNQPDLCHDATRALSCLPKSDPADSQNQGGGGNLIVSKIVTWTQVGLAATAADCRVLTRSYWTIKKTAESRSL